MQTPVKGGGNVSLKECIRGRTDWWILKLKAEGDMSTNQLYAKYGIINEDRAEWSLDLFFVC